MRTNESHPPFPAGVGLRLSGILFAFGVAGLVAISGCGGQPREASKRSMDAAVEVAGRNAPAEPGEPIDADVPNQKPAAAEKLRRKIKYSAELRLITDDFLKAKDDLIAIVSAHDGFVAFADIATAPGQPRFGVWRARVPVEKFDAFCKAIEKIGEVESNKVNTEDVTAQFYDLENHIKNKKAQEDALRELLRKTTDKMENLLAVQRELAAVRDAIERSEGQLRLLANLTDLTTVTVRIQERRRFNPDKPPEQVEKPTFGTRADRAFSESWRGVVEFVQDVAIIVVGLTPWLPLVALVGGAAWFAIRRLRRRNAK